MIRNQELLLLLQAPVVLTVVRARIEEAISQQTHAVLEVATTEDLDVAAVLEKEAAISLMLDVEEARRWSLRVAEVSFLGSKDGSLRYRISLRPAMWFLRFTTDTRKFRNMSSRDIVAKIFAEKTVPGAWQLMREPEQRKYCVQYRETQLDFVSRLLEFEGIYYSFAGDGTVRLADASGGSPMIDGAPLVELIEAEGAMSWDRTGLFEVAKGARVASGRATVNDFNWKKPKVPLLASVAASEDAELEIYDYPVGYRRPDQGARLAQTRLEAQRVPAKFVAGRGNVPAFAPARRFDFAAGASSFGGEYLLVEVVHDFVNNKFQVEGGTGLSYRNSFHAIPKSVPFRPPLVTPHPEIAGTHTAMVRGPAGEEIHTDAHGRFRAQFHWDREAVGTDDDSRWLRQLQETATSMGLARVGWEQTVAYLNGDPDRPVGIARNINGVMQAEYPQPLNKTRMTIKTPTYPSNGGFNELRLEDLMGKMHFDWKAEKDWVGDVVNDRYEHVGNDELHTVGTSMTHNVEHDQTVDIGGNLETKVGVSYPFSVGGDRSKSVGGNEQIEVGSVRALATQQNESEKVGGDRKVTAGEEEGEGAITRKVAEDLTRKIGGPWLISGDGNIQATVQQQLTETVSGSKIVVAQDGSIVGTVTGKLDSTIQGSVVRIAAKSMGFSAKNSDIEVKGASMMSAGQKIAINGDHIQIEASAMIKLQSGALAIQLTPGQASIQGKMKLEPGNELVVTGAPDNITR
jgi:type VI secretion system secreted protein VgrG